MAVGGQGQKPNFEALLATAESQSANFRQKLLNAMEQKQAFQQGNQTNKRRGQGENFWQFRPYQAGEASNAIDWRRSARDNQLYVREHEQENAQLINIIPDLGRSMDYISQSAQVSKLERALLWSFFLADFYAKQNERLAVPHLLSPSQDQKAAANLAAALKAAHNYPARSGIATDFTALQSGTQCFIISDFLAPLQHWQTIFTILAEKKIHPYCIIIADPAEIDFPFYGETIFHDIEGQQQVYMGKAQTKRQAYLEAYLENRNVLKKQITAIQGKVLEDVTNLPFEQKMAQLALFLETS